MFKKIKQVFNEWGGANATSFTYLHLSHDLCTGLLSPLLPLIKIGLGISYLQSGILLAAFTITTGLSQFVGGWFGDRFNRRVVIIIGLGGVGLATLAAGLSSSYYQLLVTLVIMGVMAGAYHPSAISLLAGLFGEDKRGKVIALHMVGGSIGFTLAPVFGGIIAGALEWRFAYILLAIPALVAALMVLFRFRWPVAPSVAETEEIVSFGDDYTAGRVQRRMGIWPALRPVLGVTVLAVGVQLVAGITMSFFPVYLVDKHGVAPTMATMLLGVIRGGGILGSLFGGWLSDRWGRRNTIILALAAAGPMLYLLVTLPYNAASVVFFAIFGAIMFMRPAAVQALLIDSVPPYLRATVIGIYFGLAMEGTSLLQPVAGYFMDVFGIADVFYVIALVSVAVSVISLLLLRRPRLPQQ